MKNEPKIIYLNIGDDVYEDEKKALTFEQYEHSEVTWSTHKIYELDIKYVNIELITEFLRVNPKATHQAITEYLEGIV